MGRPKKQIDQKAFEGLCQIQCTKPEICEFFGLVDKTLDRWCKDTYNQSFYAVFQRKRGTGKISLRRNMFRLSENNASMAMFLAKNWLGMKDHPDQDEQAVPAVPVAVNIVVSSASKSKGE